MSQALDTLLDPVRREQCRVADEAETEHALAGTMAAALRMPTWPRRQRTALQDVVVADLFGDVDSFANWLVGECFQHNGETNNADRAMRLPHRMLDAPNATVLAALLISADRGDAKETLRCAQLLAGRWLLDQDDRLHAMVSEAEADARVR